VRHALPGVRGRTVQARPCWSQGVMAPASSRPVRTDAPVLAQVWRAGRSWQLGRAARAGAGVAVTWACGRGTPNGFEPVSPP
jgi:hypothetical protein